MQTAPAEDRYRQARQELERAQMKERERSVSRIEDEERTALEARRKPLVSRSRAGRFHRSCVGPRIMGGRPRRGRESSARADARAAPDWSEGRRIPN
ncbi:hypothetical protein BV20DRAFT_963594 [Pilatotrama ljubarskyi]|nr:hypothetical protein BV20DRAFT_963594 [Pilatotrama ljubarskyi]